MASILAQLLFQHAHYDLFMSKKRTADVYAPGMEPARFDFGDYQRDAASWITLAGGAYYPDILPEAS